MSVNAEDAAVRHDLSTSIKNCRLSREEIAEQMSALLNIRVTEKMLNGYTGESNEAYRWPASFELAFCRVTGDWSLLSERARRAGFRMIGPEDERLIQIGRAYVVKREAEAILSEVQA